MSISGHVDHEAPSLLIASYVRVKADMHIKQKTKYIRAKTGM